MADTTMTRMPVSHRAGDTLRVTLDLADYPADSGWTVTYEFRRKDGSLISITSEASGAQHLLSVDAISTSVWLPGLYRGVAYVTDGTDRYTIWSGTLEVLPDLAQAGDNYDTRTHAERCLDAINLVLEGKATRDVLMTTIAGQSITRLSFDELLRAKAYYESIVAAERAKERGGAGLQILARFTRP